jgi:hypothetical protein
VRVIFKQLTQKFTKILSEGFDDDFVSGWRNEVNTAQAGNELK